MHTITNDIVTRLRRHDHDWLPDTNTLCDYCDALYEIERLRAEIVRRDEWLIWMDDENTDLREWSVAVGAARSRLANTPRRHPSIAGSLDTRG